MPFLLKRESGGQVIWKMPDCMCQLSWVLDTLYFMHGS